MNKKRTQTYEQRRDLVRLMLRTGIRLQDMARLLGHATAKVEANYKAKLK